MAEAEVSMWRQSVLSWFSRKSAQTFVLGVGCWLLYVVSGDFFLDLSENELRKHLPGKFLLIKNEG